MLSIVMPARNAEKYLNPSVDSIIHQDFQDWELVFINDGSTDSTAEIIGSYTDSRIKYYEVDEPKGVAHARNYGCSKALSEIIVVADSDDIYYPRRLTVINEAFSKDRELVVFYSNIRIINHITGEKFVRPFQKYNRELLKNINYIANMSAAFKKYNFDVLGGYDESLLSAEDYDLWLRFAREDYKIYGLNEVLVDANRYSESTSANRGMLKECTHAVKRKNNLPEISDLDYVRMHSSEGVFEYFTKPSGFELWFK